MNKLDSTCLCISRSSSIVCYFFQQVWICKIVRWFYCSNAFILLERVTFSSVNAMILPGRAMEDFVQCDDIFMAPNSWHICTQCFDNSWAYVVYTRPIIWYFPAHNGRVHQIFWFSWADDVNICSMFSYFPGVWRVLPFEALVHTGHKVDKSTRCWYMIVHVWLYHGRSMSY